jgi:hypothetical protein
MGQRHQVYIFVADDHGVPHGCMVHHQWLYGRTAGIQVIRMMKCQKKAAKEKYHPFTCLPTDWIDETRDALKAIYSLIPEVGYFHNITTLEDKWEKECMENPKKGDNNDGITIYDFTNPKVPTYCMMNIHEQDKKSSSVHALPLLTPCSVEEYIRAYYPLGGSDYQKETWTPKQFASHEKTLAKLFRDAKPFRIMPKSRVKFLFPKLYE